MLFTGVFYFFFFSIKECRDKRDTKNNCELSCLKILYTNKNPSLRFFVGQLYPKLAHAQCLVNAIHNAFRLLGLPRFCSASVVCWSSRPQLRSVHVRSGTRSVRGSIAIEQNWKRRGSSEHLLKNEEKKVLT